MGLFDNFLNAVESGALEERLHKVADTLDGATQKVEKTLGTAADKPSQVAKTIETKAKNAKTHVGKSMDILHKKD